MYSVDDRDRVQELRDIPQSSVGAPCPVVLASQQATLVAYFLQGAPVDGQAPGDISEPSFLSRRLRLGGGLHRSARMVPESSSVEAALVRFKLVRAVMFGPPNDEAFSGHPLADRGLHPYGAFEVLESSWIHRLERMNAVHPNHRPEHFADYRHFVLAFHDEVFECVAKHYTFEMGAGPLTELVARAASHP